MSISLIVPIINSSLRNANCTMPIKKILIQEIIREMSSEDIKSSMIKKYTVTLNQDIIFNVYDIVIADNNVKIVTIGKWDYVIKFDNQTECYYSNGDTIIYFVFQDDKDWDCYKPTSNDKFND